MRTSSSLDWLRFMHTPNDYRVSPRKRKYDLRMIWNTIFYLVKTGCQWRMLPKEFPKWESVYYYYRKWASLDVFDLLLDRLRGHVRVERSQNMEPSVGIYR